MAAVVHPPAPSRALERLRAAIGHCRHAGIAVRIGALGVVATGRAGMPWDATPARTVNPVGAALIAFQPPAMRPYDTAAQEVAVALAIGCDLPTMAGILDGLANKRPTNQGWSYTDGYAAGLQLRAELLAPAGALRVVS